MDCWRVVPDHAVDRAGGGAEPEHEARNCHTRCHGHGGCMRNRRLQRLIISAWPAPAPIAHAACANITTPIASARVRPELSMAFRGNRPKRSCRRKSTVSPMRTVPRSISAATSRENRPLRRNYDRKATYDEYRGNCPDNHASWRHMHRRGAINPGFGIAACLRGQRRSEDYRANPACREPTGGR